MKKTTKISALPRSLMAILALLGVSGLALAMLGPRVRETTRLRARMVGLQMRAQSGEMELLTLRKRVERYRTDSDFVAQLARSAGLVKPKETVYVHKRD